MVTWTSNTVTFVVARVVVAVADVDVAAVAGITKSHWTLCNETCSSAATSTIRGKAWKSEKRKQCQTHQSRAATAAAADFYAANPMGNGGQINWKNLKKKKRKKRKNENKGKSSKQNARQIVDENACSVAEGSAKVKAAGREGGGWKEGEKLQFWQKWKTMSNANWQLSISIPKQSRSHAREIVTGLRVGERERKSRGEQRLCHKKKNQF